MAIMVIYPDRYVSVCFSGIKLWCYSVLPSLLPFFFLTAILTKLQTLGNAFDKTGFITKPLFNCNGIALYAFFTSVISGYPVGSRTVCDLHNANFIDDDEAKRLAVLASTSGPLFIIGAVGSAMLGNKNYGLIIYCIHVFSAIIACVTLKNRGKKPPKFSKTNLTNGNCDNVLYESVYSSVISTLIVGGFIAVFYVISDVLIDFKILYPISQTLNLILSLFSKEKLGDCVAAGLIECTKGCYLLSQCQTTPLTLALIAFLTSFGGFSVIAQSMTYLKKAKVGALYFCLAKLLQATYAFILSIIVFNFIL